MSKKPTIPFDKSIDKINVKWDNNPLLDEIPEKYKKDGKSPKYEGAKDMRQKNKNLAEKPVDYYREGHYSEEIEYSDHGKIKVEGDYLFLVQINEDNEDNPDKILKYVSRPEPPFGGGLTPIERNLQTIKINSQGIQISIINQNIEIINLLTS